MINNGRLRNRIQILGIKQITTEIGSDKNVWQVIATVYAEIRALRGKEYIESVVNQSQTTYKITVKYTNSIKGISSNNNICYQNKYFDIESVIDVNNHHDTLEIMCKEHIGNDIEIYVSNNQS